jgi:hypothetical protein
MRRGWYHKTIASALAACFTHWYKLKKKVGSFHILLQI